MEERCRTTGAWTALQGEHLSPNSAASLVRLIERRSKLSLAVGGILLAAFAGWVDDVTGMEVSVALLYLVPVILTAWYVGRWMGIVVSTQCAIEGFVAGISGLPSYTHPAIPYWNAVMMLGYYVAVTLLLVALKESRDHEDRLARSIQENLLPGSLEVSPATTVAALWKPSVHVGGDYYDLLPLGPDRIGLCIADVTGHGIPAALLMSNVQSAVRLLAKETNSPADLCSRLNRQAVVSFPAEDYLTFFFGVLHLSSKRLVYSNAGHNPPIILRTDGSVDLLRDGGIPLGAVHSWTYHEESAPLGIGDVIVLYTDGVTEARNTGGELFGEERLIHLLARNRSHGPERMKDAVLEAIESHSQGNLDDDLTLVCLAINGVVEEGSAHPV